MREILLRLIKVCEENRELNFRITCEPVFSFEGEFIKFKFFLDTYNAYDQTREGIWVVKKDFKKKSISIMDIINKSCKCPPLDAENLMEAVNHKCNCKLISEEEAEQIHYNKIIEEIKERLTELKSKID
jgi:hypothetical protein